MRKQILLVVAFLLTGITFAAGQTADPIRCEKVFGGYSFHQGGQRLTMRQLVDAMEHNEQAYQTIKSARSSTVIANILGGVGGAMIGWQLGAAVAGGEPNWAVAGIGAAVIVVAIPISSGANKKAKQAVDLYNSGLNDNRATSFWDRTDVRLCLSGNGMGMVMYF